MKILLLPLVLLFLVQFHVFGQTCQDIYNAEIQACDDQYQSDLDQCSSQFDADLSQCAADADAAFNVCSNTFNTDLASCDANHNQSISACDDAYNAAVGACVFDPWNPEAYFECVAQAAAVRDACKAGADLAYTFCKQTAYNTYNNCVQSAIDQSTACIDAAGTAYDACQATAAANQQACYAQAAADYNDCLCSETKILVAKSKADYKCNDTAFYYLKGDLSSIYAFVWAVSPGLKIIAGQGTPGIYVVFSPSALSKDNIISYTYFYCSNEVQASFSVNPHIEVPPQPSAIKGDSKICPDNEGSYSISSEKEACTYLWSAPANATIVSGQGTKSVTIQFLSGFNGGTISVMAQNAAGNSLPASKSIGIKKDCSGQGPEDEETQSAAIVLSVYPNPTNGHFEVSLNVHKEISGDAIIHLINSFGQEIKSMSMPMNNGELSSEISLTNAVPEGIYLLMVVFDNKVYTRQVLYQK